MSTRRASLTAVRQTETTNAGLWLDKFIGDQARQDTNSRSDLVREVSGILMPPEYPLWFEGWQKALRDSDAVCREAEVLGRMAVGLGEDSVLETSIDLHHTYGVPYIPGSALKGLAAGFARQHLGEYWQADTQAYQVVFGDAGTTGYVIFFDALPLPGSKLLHIDVVTVHHQKYYRGDGLPPADWDSPKPVPFLSATGKYLVALAGPAEWVRAAFDILSHALAYSGIGAKTSSGYGRLRLETRPHIDPDQEKVDQLINQVQALKTVEVAGSVPPFCEKWRKLDVGPVQKQRIAAAIVAKVKEAGREKQSQNKGWYQELLACLWSSRE